MSSPFFSVVIPTLNEEAYIGRLLDDLVQQTEPAFEVIVVDGKSSDLTRKIVEKFSTKRKLTLLTSKIKNVSVQRNQGARTARGKYLVFFDADIQLSAGFLSRLRLKISETQPAFATTVIRPDSDSVYDEVIATFANIGTELALMIEKPFVPGFNFIIRKKVFLDARGFRKEVVHGEDFDLSLRLYKQGHKMSIFKQPQLIYSLRRFREEGRLSVIRKHARAALHILTKGPITKEMFSYPMGGGWYKNNHNDKHLSSNHRVEMYMQKLKEFFWE